MVAPALLPRNSRYPGVGLVLQGGGARAAYQVGVLKALSEILGHPQENPFPIITGTSAGAINAAVLSSNADNFARGVATLVKVWEDFTPDQVYRTDFPGVAKNSLRWLSAFLFGAITRNHRVSLFDNSPLADLIARYAPLARIGEHLDSGVLRAVCVTAAGYTSGQNCAFFQAVPAIQGWKRSQRVGIRVSQLRTEHLMASAAIPFAFPAIKINREFFGDGSIRQMAPISPALHLGAERVFVVGTAKLVKDVPTRTRGDTYPSLAQIAGHAMASIFLDTLAVDIELLQRINGTLTVIDHDKLKNSRIRLNHIDVLVACPQETLDTLAFEHVHNLPWTIRFLMRSIGAMRKGGATLASYMLFDRNYCRALIDMGYRDLMARREEVLLFFDPNVCPMPPVIPVPKFDPGRTLQMEADPNVHEPEANR
ncbi:MAG TPA: patatin-like phospholipase family protein [Usitatibacteraceae bacterium]|nr:patatin-like phospholipase family protein [Usitatibacteraceae bacterium]